MSSMRYLVKCKLNSGEKDRLVEDVKLESLAIIVVPLKK
jgi:hypothetical protein